MEIFMVLAGSAQKKSYHRQAARSQGQYSGDIDLPMSKVEALAGTRIVVFASFHAWMEGSDSVRSLGGLQCDQSCGTTSRDIPSSSPVHSAGESS